MEIKVVLPDNTTAAKLVYGYLIGDDDGHVSMMLGEMAIVRPKDGETYITEECK